MAKNNTVVAEEMTRRAQFKMRLLKEDVAKALEMWAAATMHQGSDVRILEIGGFDEDNMIDLVVTLVSKEG